jgi:hypothetical protein
VGVARRVITAREQHELAEPFLRLAAEEPLADWEKELMAGAEAEAASFKADAQPEAAPPPGVTADILKKHYPEHGDYTINQMAEDWSHGGDLAAQQQRAHEHLTKLTTPGHSFYSPEPGGHADKWKAKTSAEVHAAPRLRSVWRALQACLSRFTRHVLVRLTLNWLVL